MNIKIKPKKLTGSINAVSSKSFAHRQITAAMMCDSETEIIINGFSDDIMKTLSCVRKMGGDYSVNGKSVLISPVKSKKNVVLDCGESGTTARIMLPVSTVCTHSAVITGTGRLPERPFGEVTKVLREHGCSVSSDTLPITVSGIPNPGDYSIPGNISSQYITGLMLALPRLSDDSSITLTAPLKSSAYVNITIEALKDFGIDIIKTDNRFFVPSAKYNTPGKITAEGDWSNAAFWLVANELGCNIQVQNLNLNSVQGDRKITNIMSEAEIDVDEIPDLFPILAVLAAGKKGVTKLVNAGRLRFKESDRIEAVYRLLKNLGGNAEVGVDSLTIYGTGSLNGGTVNSFNDHRIVMSAAIAAVICENEVTIINAQAVNKSYPSFFEDYKKLGGNINVI